MQKHEKEITKEEREGMERVKLAALACGPFTEPFILDRKQLEGIAVAAMECLSALEEKIAPGLRRPWRAEDPYDMITAVSEVISVVHLFLTPEERHENWRAKRQMGGWSFGDVYDEVKMTDPSMVEYMMLPVMRRMCDRVFDEAVWCAYHSAKRQMISDQLGELSLRGADILADAQAENVASRRRGFTVGGVSIDEGTHVWLHDTHGVVRAFVALVICNTVVFKVVDGQSVLFGASLVTSIESLRGRVTPDVGSSVASDGGKASEPPLPVRELDCRSMKDGTLMAEVMMGALMNASVDSYKGGGRRACVHLHMTADQSFRHLGFSFPGSYLMMFYGEGQNLSDYLVDLTVRVHKDVQEAAPPDGERVVEDNSESMEAKDVPGS